MAAFNFPNSPNTNDTHTENGVQWKYNGYAWDRVESVGAQGATGAQGAQGAPGNDGNDGVAGLDIATGPPSNPTAGDLWWDSDDGDLHVYYNDGDSSQWVTVSQGPAGSPGGLAPFVSNWQIPLGF